MIRKRSFLLTAFVIIIVFFFTTNYLLFSLTAENEVRNTLENVSDKIYQQLAKLPHSYKIKSTIIDNSTEEFIRNVNKDFGEVEIDFRKVWDRANAEVTKTQLYNISSANLGLILHALVQARILKADVDSRGTQLKFLLHLEGNQQAIFKPQWYPLDYIVEGQVYAGKDRYNSEILAFYLSAILKMPLTAFTVERQISLRHDILPVATKKLSATSFYRNNKTCIYGKCFYCKPQSPICDNEQHVLKGAVIFNVKAALKKYRSPWQRVYVSGKQAAWEQNDDYCSSVRNKLRKKRLFDLIDTSIFDFLVQNGDRHHYETMGDNTVVLIDNGKGLGNPHVNHIDILAPLYQCCIIRRETWKTLLGLSGGTLRENLEKIPAVRKVVTKAHLKAIEERLLIVFATIEYCKNVKKNEHYLH